MHDKQAPPSASPPSKETHEHTDSRLASASFPALAPARDARARATARAGDTRSLVPLKLTPGDVWDVSLRIRSHGPVRWPQGGRRCA
jgi:hypothetical protein